MRSGHLKITNIEERLIHSEKEGHNPVRTDETIFLLDYIFQGRSDMHPLFNKHLHSAKIPYWLFFMPPLLLGIIHATLTGIVPRMEDLNSLNDLGVGTRKYNDVIFIMSNMNILFDARKHIELHTYALSASKVGRWKTLPEAFDYSIAVDKDSLLYNFLRDLTNYETTITNGITAECWGAPLINMMLVNKLNKLSRFVRELLDCITECNQSLSQ